MNHISQKEQTPKKNRLFGVFGVCLLIIPMMAVLFVPNTAKAVLVEDVPLLAHFQAKEVKLGFEQAVLSGVMGGVVNAMSYFTRKLAYDAAVYLANGGKGESALIYQGKTGEYLKNVYFDSIASGIGEAGKPFGLDFCSIPDVRLSALLQIGLSGIYGVSGPQPTCSFQQFRNGWNAEAFEQRYGPGSRKNILRNFSDSVKVENTDFGLTLTTIERIDGFSERQVNGSALDRQEGKGFKAITGLISDKIYTPADHINKEFEVLSAKNQQEISSQQIAGIYSASTDYIISSAGQVFLNTLTSQLLDRAIKGLLKEEDETSTNEEQTLSDFFATVINGKEAAQNAFSFLITRPPQRDTGNFDVVAEFAACPENPGPNNCVIDDKFRDILRRGERGVPITLGEALEEGDIDGDLPFISPRRQADNESPNCRLDGYCYSNLQKLRRMRIVPVGFELAALKSDPDRPEDWTLQKVVDGFNECDLDDAGVVIPNPEKPYCQLINPNWILRAPAARCEARGFNEQLASPNSAAGRQESCLDISTCVAEGENGECLRSYGFCTKEKNVWRLGGDQCDAQYATCETVRNIRTNATESYLLRTVDFGQCDENTVGCRVYSTEQSEEDWVRSSDTVNLAQKAAGRNANIYFNERLTGNQCDASAAGCSGFFLAESTGDGYLRADLDPVYVKKAPDYLGCYDINRANNSPEVDYPTTNAQLALLPENEQCGDYARVCIEEEIGCQAHIPVNGGPTVPGIVGNNVCSESCVGYATYRQVGYQDAGQGFEEEIFPLHFIATGSAAVAVQCPATYVGCDEFTNIDERERGGEGLEYYTKLKYCERPDGTNINNYFTWEGSAEDGFVLKTHELRPVKAGELDVYQGLFSDDVRAEFSIGSPAYADDQLRTYVESFEVCNELAYNNLINNAPFGKANPDCRAFYDNNANIYYRLLDGTVTVSDACHPLRKTENFFEQEPILDNQNVCEEKNGFWDGASCALCTGGGQYDNGACLYWTISEQGESSSCKGPSGNEGAYAGCRSYVGNSGNVRRELFGDSGDTFEPSIEDNNALVEARAGWGPEASLRVVPESPQVGLYSLQVNSQVVIRTIDVEESENEDEEGANGLTTGSLYEMTFWARGSVAQRLSIILEQSINGDIVEVGQLTFDPIQENRIAISLGSSWQQYRVGPTTFTGDETLPVSITFRRTFVDQNVTGPYYLDTVRLTRVDDNVPLIKESWQTSEGFDVLGICDANPEDAFPGDALGCEEYSVNGQPVYATGFEKLCRTDAIGCAPLYDTHNTLDETRAKAYRVWCESDEIGECSLENALIANDELGVCTVRPGQLGCYIDEVIVNRFEEIPETSIKPSTVFIPSDTPTDTPIFLTVRDEHRCREDQRGCQEIALEEQVIPDENSDESFEFSSVHVLNDPALYLGPNGILCHEDALGCGAFDSAGERLYFVDPVSEGNKWCYYKSPSGSNTGDQYGWYKQGVGRCSEGDGNLFRVDGDCVGDTNSCENIGDIPCYDNFLDQGGEYGVWSNESENYEGFTGLCPARQNGCTELVDPADTSNVYPDGQPYYTIFNSNITRRISECNGQVSLEEGCVLFDQTDRPNKVYASNPSYVESERNDFELVPVISSPNLNANDANLILKVDRDRSCSEWLACQSHVPITDENGKTTDVCYEYRACNEGIPGGICTNWVETEDSFSSQLRLTETRYIQRGSSWYDEEYVGYSILNKFQPKDLVEISIKEEREGRGDQNIQFLVYEMPPHFFNIPQNVDIDELPLLLSDARKGCFAQPVHGIAEKDNWEVCGLDNGGRCYDDRCIYPVNGQFAEEVVESSSFEKKIGELTGGICKAFPEEDAPFPDTVTDQEARVVRSERNGRFRNPFTTKGAPYQQANICQDGENCSCQYTKVTYGSGVVDYWGAVGTTEKIPLGVCVSSVNEGDPCETDDHCGESGTCSFQKVKEKYVGLKGYCLEFDLSRPTGDEARPYACQTWLPIDTSASQLDIFNTFENAGYNPSVDAVSFKEFGPQGGEVYCTDSDANGAAQYVEDQFTPIGDYDPHFRVNNPNNDDRPRPRCITVNGNSTCSDLSLSAYESFRDYYIAYHNDVENGGEFNFPSADHPFTFLYRFKNFNERNRNSIEYIDGLYSFLKMWAWHEEDIPNSLVWYIREGFMGFHNGITGNSALRKQLSSNEVDQDPDERYRHRVPDIQVIDTDISKVYYAPIILDSTHGLRPAPQPQFKPYTILNEPAILDFEALESQLLEPGEFVIAALPQEITLGVDRLGRDGGREKEFSVVSFKGRVQDDEQNIDVIRYGFVLLPSVCQEFGPDRSEDGENPRARECLSEGFPTETELNQIVGAAIDMVDLPPNNFHGAASLPNRAVFRFPMIHVEDFSLDGVHERTQTSKGDRYEFEDSYRSFIDPVIAATVQYKTRCTAYDLVYEPEAILEGKSTNKAWTNRVWEHARRDEQGELILIQEGEEEIVHADTVFRPYGSVDITSGLFKASNQGNIDDLKDYSFNDLETSGIPYACKSALYENTNVFQSSNAGTGFCSGLGDTIEDHLPGPRSPGNGRDLLRFIFAKSFTQKRVAREPVTYRLTEEVGFDNADALARSQGVRPPKIFSLNPAKCFEEGGTNCIVGEENNITVNKRNGTLKDYDGDGRRDEDINNTGEAQHIIARRNFPTTVQFFAHADEDTMPIRRVMVDWGDRTITNQYRKGLYKNRKPFCEERLEDPDLGYCGTNNSLEAKDNGLTCREDSDCPSEANTCFTNDEGWNSFGSAIRACEPKPFTFGHNYTCTTREADQVVGTSPLLSEQDRSRLLNLGLRNSDTVCIFKPRVQVLDNWGRCNGVDSQGNPTVYYEGDDLNFGFDECEAINDLSWTTYNGKVIIIPRK